MPKNNEVVTCTRILSVMLFVCFIIQYMLRVNISIAIVDMTSQNASNTTNHYDWSESQKTLVLSSFFIGYVLFTLPGGRFSELYGTKKVLGYSTLLSGILNGLIPIACEYHFSVLVVIRILIGMALGTAFPALPPMISKWVPPRNRAKFLGIAVSAALGAVITWPICGFLIPNFGWPSVFYTSSIVAILFSIAWFYLIYDSPSEHPRISKEELVELLKEIKIDHGGKKQLPWKKMLVNGPVWALVVSMTSFLFSWYFILTNLPLYMKTVLHFDIKENGFLSSIPYLATYLVSLLSCYLSDRWIKNQTFSVIVVRKIFVTVITLIPAILFLLQSFFGYDRNFAVVMFTLIIGLKGGFPPGFYSNSIDLSPIYSGSITGIGTLFGSLAGFLAIVFLGIIVKEHQDFQHWKYIFWVLAAMDFIGYLYYMLCSSADLQDFNPSPTCVEMNNLNQNDEVDNKETI